MSQPSMEALIAALELVPHPEGGYYRETWRDHAAGRGHGTAIYFLLPKGRWTGWHRVDATEIWHFYGGAALTLERYDGQLLLRDTLSGRMAAIRLQSGRPSLIDKRKHAKTRALAIASPEFTVFGLTALLVAPGTLAQEDQ